MTTDVGVAALSPDAVAQARAEMRTLGRAAHSARARVDAASPAPQEWAGAAAEAYLQARARLSARVTGLATVSADVHRVLYDYQNELTEAQARIRRAKTRVEEAERLRNAQLAAGQPLWTTDGSGELGEASRQHEQALDDYRQAARRAAQRLRPLIAQVAGTNKPLGLGDHVEVGVDRLVRDAVLDPWNGFYSLTVAAFVDPAAWRSAWAALPGGMFDAVTDAVTHPVDTLQQEVAWLEWSEGRWGEAVGANIAGGIGLLGGRGWLLRSDDGKPFPQNRADPHAPRPVPQTVDEMIAGVDLSRSEHFDLGHAIRRHIDVTDEFLQDRLVHGTLKDRGGRQHGAPPREVSAWNDLETAEREITRLLRDPDQQQLLREWALGDKDRLRLEGSSSVPIGRVMSRDGPDFPVRPGRGLVVEFARSQDMIYIKTTFIEVGS